MNYWILGCTPFSEIFSFPSSLVQLCTSLTHTKVPHGELFASNSPPWKSKLLTPQRVYLPKMWPAHRYDALLEFQTPFIYFPLGLHSREDKSSINILIYLEHDRFCALPCESSRDWVVWYQQVRTSPKRGTNPDSWGWIKTPKHEMFWGMYIHNNQLLGCNKISRVK